MQGIHLRKYGVEAKIDFVLYEVDGVDFRTDWTPAAGDVFMMRDEAAEEQVTNAAGNADLSTLVTDEGRGYSITLALEDMQAARVVIYLVDQATKAFLDWPIIIETYGNASAQHAFDLDTAATAMRGTDSAALASAYTAARAGYLDELAAANLPTDIAAIPTTAMRGTDSAALASGVDVTKIHGTAITETTPGMLAANFTTFIENADSATAKTLDDVGAPAAGGGSPLVLGAGDVGDFKKDGVVHFFWNTIDRSGAAKAPSTAGTLRVYKDDGTGEVTAPTGITDTRAFDGVTGLQECKVDLSATTFYAKEKNYSVILVGAVIDTKTVNIKVGSFSIENRWANVHWEYGGN